MASAKSSPSGSSSSNNSHLFHTWLHGLSWNDLREATACRLSDSNINSRNSKNSNHTNDTDDTEWKLWQELVKQASPLPAPIHPAAGCPQAATERFVFHGWQPPSPKPFRLLRLVVRNNHNDDDPYFRGNVRFQRRRNQPKKPVVVVVARRMPRDMELPMDQVAADRELVTKWWSIVRNPGDQSSNNNSCIWGYLSQWGNAEEFLLVLKTVSRGELGSSGPPTKKNHSWGIATAAWFEPTERWFPLSMAIASRIEVALWSAFQTQTINNNSINHSLDVPWKNNSWEGTPLASALARVVRTRLLDQSKMQGSLPLVRDTTLFQLLRRMAVSPSSLRSSVDEHPWQSLLSISFSQLGTPLEQMQIWLADALQTLVAEEMERKLLNDDDDDGQYVSVQPRPPVRRRRRRKKNRRAAVERTIPMSVPEDHELADDSDNDDNEPLEQQNSDSTEIPPYCARPPLPLIQDSNNKRSVSVRERNRNIIMSLSILDDVLESAFQKVGLAPTAAPFAEHDAEVAQRQAARQRYLEERDRRQRLPADTGRQRPIATHSNNSGHISTEQAAPMDLSIEGAATKSPPDEPADSSSFWSVEDRTSNGRSGASGLFTAHYETFSGGFVHRSEPMDYAWHLNGLSFDDWGKMPELMNRSRDRSIMHNLFVQDPDEEDTSSRSEMFMASSTAASIASSTEIYAVDVDVETTTESTVNDKLTPRTPTAFVETASTPIDEEPNLQKLDLESDFIPLAASRSLEHLGVKEKALERRSSAKEQQSDSREGRSPSPTAPSTPPPVLSPILVSLADLSEMRKESVEKANLPVPEVISPAGSFSPVTAASVPNSPRTASPSRRITTSLSRDNLRAAIDARSSKSGPKKSPKSHENTSGAKSLPPSSLHSKARDDTEIRSRANLRRFNERTPSYKSIASARAPKFRDDHDIRLRKTSLARPSHTQVAGRVGNSKMLSITSGHRRLGGGPQVMRPLVHLSFDPSVDARKRRESCVQSEAAAEAQEDYQNWNDSRRSSQVNDEVENVTVKDETTTITSAPSHQDPEAVVTLREERDVYRDMCLTMGAEIAKLRNMLAAQRGSVTISAPLDYVPDTAPHENKLPNSVSFENVPRALTLAAMSEAGYRGENESMASEDDVLSRQRGSKVLSSSATVVESELSVENIASVPALQPIGLSLTRQFDDPMAVNSMQSRLSRDIQIFLSATGIQLQRQDAKRMKAIERMDRLVKTVWPRARVQLYGSHITGLCLPSSDLDLVICLPNVHTRAPALAPGALEGRNAVNESSQKLLARKLKSESWIDPRSIKIIERTAVPVIKFSTKDTRVKTLQLDISFDGPGHYGLMAIEMVSATIEELPMIRPLVLTLKQFLIDRGLLTVYTGGLSSYCLFLMVARYLQEQQASWEFPGDCGSLLMGFLDFYGNHFDPRTTGISVRCRQYFPRHHMATPMYSGVWPLTSTGKQQQQFNAPDSGNQMAYEPYTLDPFLVEDPLSPENNVGRNAFRVVQIQRAFSDAHRAMQAALEWDLNSGGGHDKQNDEEYPLLKCLFQNEDQVYDM